MSPQLTFRERQLIAAFRRCDERGRSFVEKAAIDQVGFSRASAQTRPAVAFFKLVKSGGAS